MNHLYCTCIVLLLICLNLNALLCFDNADQYENNGNGYSETEGLFLTPYIENDQLEEARLASEVQNLPGIGNELKSYSGYLTVNKQYNSNSFFWFFPPLNGDLNCSVLLWLEGGPGYPSLMGLFSENGPIQVDVSGTPSLRTYTWNREFAVLYIDNPVGTGFSFTDNDSGYARNPNDIGRDLYEALRQFFLIFSDYRDNEFFLTGYSYACKYIAALANRIHHMNHISGDSGKINLKGLSIGNGYCGPRHQYNYGDFLYQIGLIDEQERKYFWREQIKFISLIDAKQYLKAFNVIDQLILSFTGVRAYYQNVTSLSVRINYLLDSSPASLRYFNQYIAKPETRQAIHVGNRTFNGQSKVLEALKLDIVQSVAPKIESILNANYRTLFYNGNLDIIVSTPLAENFLSHLKWRGAREFEKATKLVYRLTPTSEVAGYVRSADNLQFVTLRKAGHVASFDQPQLVLDMITKFVKGEEF